MESDSTSFSHFMSNSDAVMWDIEKDPVLRSTITAVAVLDRSPDWDRFVERIDAASRLIPRLRQRVVVPPLRIGPPQWVVDPDFDLGYHLRRVRVPEPGDLRDVLDLAQPIAAEAFDRARPLWEFTLVEGMADGRAALIQKIHHTITDGVGGIELALTMLDDSPEGRVLEAPPPPPPENGSAVDILRDASAERARRLVGGLSALPGKVARNTVDLVTDPVGTATKAQTLAGSLAKILAPVSEPASPVMRGRSLSRRFDFLDVSLDELKAAGHAAEGTVNDAFLAATIGGLSRYHDAAGAPTDTLRLTMPISFRRPGDPMGGNRFAPARFTVPAAIADPIRRMQELGAIARGWQHEPGMEFTEVIAAVLDRLPVSVTTAIFGGMLRNIDAVATNVPGLPETAYLAGAEVLRQYAFAPPTGAAINVALISHLDTACIGLVVDTVAVPDHERLLDCLQHAFDEVIAVGHERRVTAP